VPAGGGGGAAAGLVATLWCEVLWFLASAGRASAVLGHVPWGAPLPRVSFGDARAAVLSELSADPGNARLLSLARDGMGLGAGALRRALLARAGGAALPPAAALALAPGPGPGPGRAPEHAARSRHEAAVRDPPGAHDGRAWLAYLRFESRAGRREAARRVFFRAARACPWSKAVWLGGLRELLGGETGAGDRPGGPWVTAAEAESFIEAAAEKGVEWRCEVLEVLLARAGADSE